jgi:hypothetical protein
MASSLLLGCLSNFALPLMLIAKGLNCDSVLTMAAIVCGATHGAHSAVNATKSIYSAPQEIHLKLISLAKGASQHSTYIMKKDSVIMPPP